MKIFKTLTGLLVASSIMVSPLALAAADDYRELNYNTIHQKIVNKNQPVKYKVKKAKHTVKHKKAKHQKAKKIHKKHYHKVTYHRAAPIQGTGKN